MALASYPTTVGGIVSRVCATVEGGATTRCLVLESFDQS